MTTTTTIASSVIDEQGADADFLRQTLQHALQRLMEMDVEALCKAAYGERSEERINSRNGFRDRAYETRAGKIDLKIPKLRSGSYFRKRLFSAVLSAVSIFIKTVTGFHSKTETDSATKAGDQESATLDLETWSCDPVSAPGF